MTHQQATNILRRYYGPDWADRGFIREFGAVAVAQGINSIWVGVPERARTRHIVRGIIRR